MIITGDHTTGIAFDEEKLLKEITEFENSFNTIIKEESIYSNKIIDNFKKYLVTANNYKETIKLKLIKLFDLLAYNGEWDITLENKEVVKCVVYDIRSNYNAAASPNEFVKSFISNLETSTMFKLVDIVYKNAISKKSSITFFDFYNFVEYYKKTGLKLGVFRHGEIIFKKYDNINYKNIKNKTLDCSFKITKTPYSTTHGILPISIIDGVLFNNKNYTERAMYGALGIFFSCSPYNYYIVKKSKREYPFLLTENETMDFKDITFYGE